MTRSYSLQPGEVINYKSRIYRIESIVDLDFLIAKDEKNGNTERLYIRDIRPVSPKEPIDKKHYNFAGVLDSDWDIAKKRFKYIKPLLEADKRSSELVKQCSEEANVHRATIYRWLDKYDSSGLLSSLLPIDKKEKRKSKLDTVTEKIVADVIEHYYLQMNKPSTAATYEELKRQCRDPLQRFFTPSH